MTFRIIDPRRRMSPISHQLYGVYRGRTAAESDQHDLGRDAKPEWHDATTEATGHDNVAPFSHMAVSESVAIARRDHRRPPEQAHLAAMSRTAEHKRHPIGHSGRNVRLMREQDDGRIVSHLRQGA